MIEGVQINNLKIIEDKKVRMLILVTKNNVKNIVAENLRFST